MSMLLLLVGCTNDGAPGPGKRDTDTGVDDSETGAVDSDTADSDSGDTGTGVPLVWRSVSAGNRVTCGVTTVATDEGGTIRCWGNDGPPFDTAQWANYGVDEPPVIGNATQVFLGSSTTSAGDAGFACVVLTDGSVTCWGGIAPPFPSEVRVTAFDVGFVAACGILSDGTAECWVNADPMSVSPLWLSTHADVKSIDVGEGFLCIVEVAGSAYCGYSSQPNGNTADYSFPVPPGSYAKVVSADETCAISTTGDLSCWHFKTATPSTSLVPPTDRAPYHDLCVPHDWGWGCALDKDNLVECFGDLSVIDGVAIPADTVFASITCGANQACGLTADGQVKCWGNNDYGQTDVPVY